METKRDKKTNDSAEKVPQSTRPTAREARNDDSKKGSPTYSVRPHVVDKSGKRLLRPVFIMQHYGAVSFTGKEESVNGVQFRVPTQDELATMYENHPEWRFLITKNG